MAEAQQHTEALLPEGDVALLRQYARSQEPAAFMELSRRYAGVVYGTCLRITANVQDAEELTQDCFFELARKAATIHSSVGGWLHRLATHRALNAVRSRNRRREHEQGAAAIQAAANSKEEVAWRRLEPLLDRAIDDLPEKLRTPIVLHFLENRSQSDVASRLGMHQSTVSRRIQEALVALRARLRDSGFVMAAAPLTTLLATHAGQTADPHLLASLTKIALAGVGAKAMGGVAAALAKLSTWGKALGGLAAPIIVQLVLGGWWGALLALVFLVYIAWRQPMWLDELGIAMGGKGHRHEFFPLVRWTWTTPPAGWRMAIFQAMMASVMLGCAATTGSFIPQRNPMSLGLAAMMTVYATVPLTTALRIWLRVRACPAEARGQPVSSPPPPDGISVAQSVGMAIAVSLCVASVAVWHVRRGQPREWLFMLLIVVVSACWASVDAVGKVWSFRRARRTAIRTDGDPDPGQVLSRPGAVLGAILFILVCVLIWTNGALQQCVDYLWRGRPCDYQAVGWALCSPMALILLAATIGLFSRLRGRIPKLVWSGLGTIVVVCAALNLALVWAWLLFGPANLPPDPSRRVATIAGNLGNVLNNGAAAVPQLKKDLCGSDDDLRRRAAILLGLMDVGAAEVVPELREALSDEAKEVRSHAASALACMGTKAEAAIPELRKALGDPDRDVRFAAVLALNAIGPTAKDAVPEIQKALSDEDPMVREMAATLLSQCGAAAEDAAPDLRKALSDENERVRSGAAHVLGVIGPAAKDAIPELRKALSDPYWLARSNAARALGEIGPAARNAVPDLRKALNDPDKEVRAGAAWALGEMGPAAEKAVPGLQEASNDEDQDVRSRAASALKKIEPNGK